MCMAAIRTGWHRSCATRLTYTRNPNQSSSFLDNAERKAADFGDGLEMCHTDLFVPSEMQIETIIYLSSDNFGISNNHRPDGVKLNILVLWKTTLIRMVLLLHLPLHRVWPLLLRLLQYRIWPVLLHLITHQLGLIPLRLLHHRR